jgi:hypothetical protein
LRQDQHQQQQEPELRLYLNSLQSEHTRRAYRIYLNKYLQITGYKDTQQFLARAKKNPKEIEDQIIEFIISLKESGSKSSTITNYHKPVVGLLKLSDIVINYNKINRFVPHYVRNKKTRAYEVGEVSAILQGADERMSCVVYILQSSGVRINGLCGLTVGNLSEINIDGKSLYQITVYENEMEEYTTFCTTECKSQGILPYLKLRERYGEVITAKSPLIREQFDRRDPFAAAHPRHVTSVVLCKKLIEMAEAAGLRKRTQLSKGQKPSSVRQAVPGTNGYRRFFCSTLMKSSLKTEMRWLLEGHNLKGNDSSYVHVSNNDLLNQYMLAHNNLLISQEHKLRERVHKLEVEKTAYEALAAKVASLEQKIK